MSDIDVKVNIGPFISGLTKRNKRALRLLRSGGIFAMREFEGKVIREQMSGRSRGPGGSGLNRISRFLSGSTNVTSEEIGGGDLLVKMTVGAKYARAHQGNKDGSDFVIKHPGSSNGFGKGINIPAHDIKIPKRLRIPEDFGDSGTTIVMKHLRQAAKEYNKRV